jgi:probable rRNA maturation factor
LQQVLFHYADRKLSLTNKQRVKETIISIATKEMIVLDRLDYIFCSDAYLLDINQRFLKHDYYTDIITFNLSENSDIKGEIYISIDRVKENALMNNAKFDEEIARVIFHGFLHLCGYKDKTKEDIKVMRRKEDFYLRQLRS